MLVVTEPVQVMHRAPYSPDGHPEPLTWGQGQGQYAGNRIEKIMVLDLSNNAVLDNFTLAPGVGDEVRVGPDPVSLRCEVTAEMVSNGRGRPVVKYKWRVLGVAAKPAAVRAA